MKILSILCLIFISASVFGQKKVIDHTVYNDWRKAEAQIISNDGNYISYEINPHRGDGFLYVYNSSTSATDSFPRGKEAKFGTNNNYLVFKITPGFDTLRNCELNKVDKKKWPKDTLGIYVFAKDSLIKIPLLKSFSVFEDNDWLSYVVDENEFKTTAAASEKESKKKKSTSKKKKKSKKEEEKPAYKSDGKLLTLLNPTTEKSYQFKDITDHSVSVKGNYLAMVEHKKEKVDSFQLILVDLTNGKPTPISPKFSSIKQLSFDHSDNYLAFLSSSDTAKVKNYQLNLLDLSSKSLRQLTDSSSTFLTKEDAVSENRKPSFSEDGRFLFYGVAERLEVEKKDSLLESEKAKVDIWHYQDKRLQSQQLVELKRDLKKTDLYVFTLANSSHLKLSNDTLRVNPSEKIVGNYLFASSDEQYVMANQWEVPNLEDHYRVYLLDGSVELIKKAVGFNGDLSPSGNYYSFFDAKAAQFYLMDLTAKTTTCITCETKKVNWQEDVNGMPMLASPFGSRGYTTEEKDLIIQSEYDVWAYSIADKKMRCLTNREGEDGKIRLEMNLWSNDSIYVDYENAYIKGFNESTKGALVYTLVNHGDHTDLVKNYATDHKLLYMNRSKNAKTTVFRMSSVSEYPEIRITQDFFQTEKTLTHTNPQQDSLNWATVELVNWKSYEGSPLQGLLYKPENFDATKSYPLIVYYYELNSDDLHYYYGPKPTASIVYATEYASAGYCVFIPDIRYKHVGHPAKSAYDCIMSGTDHVLKLYKNIDSTRMGLQGQSWGGYQTAQLITMTTRYKAAMAGAPVSNMFSAYGGIRWGSGVNRQFQYERTQSRIGKTIWDAPELYTENSPIFHLPKVQTPLLIMSNDEDGAVPWYQGIELFTGMKRLGKPCWMLNYNGDDHNLMQNANRFDLSIRMRQFFDYYLQGQPAPKWLTEGIPAIEKGKTTN